MLHCKKHLKITEAVAAVRLLIIILSGQRQKSWSALSKNDILGCRGGEASLAGLYLFPIYSGQDGWALSYSVYDRNALKKMYKYEITTKVFYWLLLLPFSWINFFTYSFDDAVRSTTAQFVVDAQRDGYLGTED